MKIKHIKHAAAIVAIGAVIGIGWNFSFLRQVWRHDAPSTITPSALEKIPLPAGLSQAKQLFDEKTIFVDARDNEDYAAGHIAKAISLPLRASDQSFADFARNVPHTHPIVIYCNGYGCQDSHILAEKVIKAGFETVFVYLGGYPEWHAAGLPIEETK